MRSILQVARKVESGTLFLARVVEVRSGGSPKHEALLSESTKPLVAHPEPHRPLARGGAGFGTLAACTRLPGGHRAKTLTPLSMPPYPAFLLPTPFPKEFKLLSAFFPPSQPLARGLYFPMKNFCPPNTLWSNPMGGAFAQTIAGGFHPCGMAQEVCFSFPARESPLKKMPAHPLQTFCCRAILA